MDVLRVALLATLGLLALPPAAGAQLEDCLPSVEQQTLRASDGAWDDEFGWSLGISGDTILVGSKFHDGPAGATSGAAYVYGRSGGAWAELQRLTASDPGPIDRFGYAVALEDDTGVIGAPEHDHAGLPAGGAVYVFGRSGGAWTELQELFVADGRAGDSLGQAVALSGDTLVVGAPGTDGPPGFQSGAVHVFVRSGGTWIQEQVLTASDSAAGASFGEAVAVSGDSLVVGAAADDNTRGVDAGAVYVFVRSGGTWMEQQKLLASGPLSWRWFGSAVAIEGDAVVVGNSLGSAIGLAHVYARVGTTWTDDQVLQPSDGASSDEFGYSVALLGDRILVGAILHDTGGAFDQGSAYLFERAGGAWTEQAELSAAGGGWNDYFGTAVAMSTDTIVVGGLENPADPGVLRPGSAWVFACEPSTPACNATATAASCGRVVLDAGRLEDDVVGVAWSSPDCADAVITPDPADASLATADVAGCRGCTFDLLVTNAAGRTCADRVAVGFTDSTPPSIASAGDALCLWPPSHRVACFDASDFHVSVTDDCAVDVSWRFIACASDQADDDIGDGNTSDDCVVSADGQRICVRAERDGRNAAGRTYAVVVGATDACGNASSAEIGTIHVPHDVRPGARPCGGH